MKLLLDFISKPESNGNYNAYYGKANSTKDLSAMTVKEILLWMKARTDAGSPSSATGRYQFMRKTLLGLIRDLGIPESRKFTPELQDYMATHLLKIRGLDKFLAGKLSKEGFALNLSKEWASLPNPVTGKSYYAGDGLNKSHVSVQAVYDVLEAIRKQPSAPGTPVAPTVPEASPEAPKGPVKGLVPGGILAALVALGLYLIQQFG
jgi:muramidase (phage lysozyme)